MAILLFLARHFLGRVYSNEPEVINNVAKLGPITALISFMDDIQRSISATAAAANLGAYYIVGVPIAYSLAFHFGLNGKGLVIGILCGTGTQPITFLLISSVFTNWEKQAETLQQGHHRECRLRMNLHRFAKWWPPAGILQAELEL
ncbi:hypothetical protein SELMODRAFT_424404 [Selaginella moellendorffii]|uniref:Uncharacterized protein n=1 Tax=Selaginella moellendorffii TaxID=88036 RepID=D8SPS5_SELML|nr:hypothetical protein SELMODRAFT_424404 [Selaginella moellendorffii]